MKEPNHNVKRQVKRNLDKSYHWAEPFQVYGWLASGLYDRNGKEIFEGDKVIFGDLEFQGVVIFKNGALGVEFSHFCKERFTTLDSLIGFTEIEVVGHVAEEDEQ